MQPQDLIIPLSKKKLVVFVLLLLVVAAVSLFSFVVGSQEEMGFSKVGLLGVAVFLMLFFILLGFLLIKKLFDSKPGLKISDEGIWDNSASLIGERFIPWKEVTGFDMVDIKGTELLIILVKNPQIFMNHQKSYINKMMQSSLKNYGSPIVISTHTLKIKFDELCHQLTQRWESIKAKN